MKKTKSLVSIFSALCLLATITYANALATAEYVNVKAGDTFEYVMVIGGTTAYNPWPGTYDVTLVIDNLTDNGSNTTIAFH